MNEINRCNPNDELTNRSMNNQLGSKMSIGKKKEKNKRKRKNNI